MSGLSTVLARGFSEELVWTGCPAQTSHDEDMALSVAVLRGRYLQVGCLVESKVLGLLN